MTVPDWLTVRPGRAPLIVSLPHTGLVIPETIEAGLVSPWLARKDADWWIERLYGFGAEFDATVIRTTISRTVIDVNRDPSGVSLYPGQATTDLCPTTSFDGEPLYRPGGELDAAEITRRRETYFDPYHAVLAPEIARLRQVHPRIVLYDCHSIRSVVPRLFEGTLPECNIGTNSGASCDASLTAAIESLCDAAGHSRITNGRFKGGFITRHHGRPAEGVHAIQMELACRAYLREPLGPVTEAIWPVPYDEDFAAPLAETLRAVFAAALRFATSTP